MEREEKSSEKKVRASVLHFPLAITVTKHSINVAKTNTAISSGPFCILGNHAYLTQTLFTLTCMKPKVTIYQRPCLTLELNGE